MGFATMVSVFHSLSIAMIALAAGGEESGGERLLTTRSPVADNHVVTTPAVTASGIVTLRLLWRRRKYPAREASGNGKGRITSLDTEKHGRVGETARFYH